jgi:predicted amidophosphoribosyltransferase
VALQGHCDSTGRAAPYGSFQARCAPYLCSNPSIQSQDGLIQVLQVVSAASAAEFRELLLQRESVAAAHLSDVRPTPEEVAANYTINEAVAEPQPETIFLFDDVLTTGAHFKAAERVLRNRFRGVNIVGFFLARRAPRAEDWDFDPVE